MELDRRWQAVTAVLASKGLGRGPKDGAGQSGSWALLREGRKDPPKGDERLKPDRLI